MVIDLSDTDAAIVVLSLMVTDDLLFKSRYEPEVIEQIKTNIKSIIERINDARNPPQHNSSPDEDPLERQKT